LKTIKILSIAILLLLGQMTNASGKAQQELKLDPNIDQFSIIGALKYNDVFKVKQTKFIGFGDVVYYYNRDLNEVVHAKIIAKSQAALSHPEEEHKEEIEQCSSEEDLKEGVPQKPNGPNNINKLEKYLNNPYYK